jgi:hypothetical protein
MKFVCIVPSTKICNGVILMNEIRCGQNMIIDIKEYDEHISVFTFFPQLYSWFPYFVSSILNTRILYPS